MLSAVASVSTTLHATEKRKSRWSTPIVLVPTIWIDEHTIPTPTMGPALKSEAWIAALAGTAARPPASGLTEVTSRFGNHLLFPVERFSVYFYQRVTAKQPHFCPDHALEVGAYLCFLDDWYADLPDVTVFLHQLPSVHNYLMPEWVHLLREDLTYTTLSPQYIAGRDTNNWAHLNISAWVEQCYRDVLHLSGKR